MKEYYLDELDDECGDFVDGYNADDQINYIILPPEVKQEETFIEGEQTTTTTPEIKPVTNSGKSLLNKTTRGRKTHD